MDGNRGRGRGKNRGNEKNGRGRGRGRGNNAANGVLNNNQIKPNLPGSYVPNKINCLQQDIKFNNEVKNQHFASRVPNDLIQDISAAASYAPHTVQSKNGISNGEMAQCTLNLSSLNKFPVHKNDSKNNNSETISSRSSTALTKVQSADSGANKSAFPRRPDYGKLGVQIKVKVNYFPISIPNGNVYHYDVKIVVLNKDYTESAKSPNKQACRKIIDKLSKECKEFEGCYPAYDGKATLITRNELFSGTKDFVVILEADENNSSKPFKVIIKPAKEEPAINLDELHKFIAGESMITPSRAIMALDIIMRTGLNLKLTPIGRSIFSPPNPNELHPLGGGREIWFGYYQSIRPTAWKMMVNVDRAICVFHERQSVLDFISNTMRKNITRSLDAHTNKAIEGELKGLKVRVTHQTYPRKYTIVGLTRKPLSDVTFSSENGPMKVVDYFNQQYHKVILHYKHLPALVVGSKANPKYLPLEVCEIVEGQPCRKQLSEEQTRNMIRETTLPPFQRFKEIEQGAKEIVKNNENFMKEFGLQMNTKCIELMARHINPPNVTYSNNKIVTPKFGVWDLRNIQFFSTTEIDNWILLSTVPERSCTFQHMKTFANMLRVLGRGLGITIAEPREIKTVNQFNITDNLKFFSKKHKLDLAIIILPNKSSNIYSDIKTVAEIDIGLKTQCVKEDNVKKCKESLISNLCQKINAKMGGINCGLSEDEKPKIFEKPVIFLGADVTHPSPGDKTSFSIAAVVGSLDRHPSRYAAAVQIQPPSKNKRRVEIITDLKKMVKEMLKQFFKNTWQKPEKIIFYRDGVSEGEFFQVQEKEVSQIRMACTELESDYKPGITYIVVGKRHHMRMMPVFRKDGVGKAGNVPPGTIVDQQITHPTDFDFFLCSHYGIQGTSRSAHYSVLWDDNDFSSDELQKLSYYLCHVYARCTRSISIPSPVQYAHLAAARAKHHLISKMADKSSSSSSSGSHSSSGETDDLSIDVDLLNVLKDFKSSMYFV